MGRTGRAGAGTDEEKIKNGGGQIYQVDAVSPEGNAKMRTHAGSTCCLTLADVHFQILIVFSQTRWPVIFDGAVAFLFESVISLWLTTWNAHWPLIWLFLVCRYLCQKHKAQYRKHFEYFIEQGFQTVGPQGFQTSGGRCYFPETMKNSWTFQKNLFPLALLLCTLHFLLWTEMPAILY